MATWFQSEAARERLDAYLTPPPTVPTVAQPHLKGQNPGTSGGYTLFLIGYD